MKISSHLAFSWKGSPSVMLMMLSFIFYLKNGCLIGDFLWKEETDCASALLLRWVFFFTSSLWIYYDWLLSSICIFVRILLNYSKLDCYSIANFITFFDLFGLAYLFMPIGVLLSLFFILQFFPYSFSVVIRVDGASASRFLIFLVECEADLSFS